MTAYSLRELVQQDHSFTVGRYTYGDLTVRWFGEPHRLNIGSFCSLAGGIWVYVGGNHVTDFVTTYPFGADGVWPSGHGPGGLPLCVGKGSVNIGNDVWIGDRAVIMSGVTVGHGAVIAANAVVSRDVPAYAVVAGSPAAVKRYRIAQEFIPRMLAVRWWDWEDEQIKRTLGLMLSPDIASFLEEAEKISEARGFQQIQQQ